MMVFKFVLPPDLCEGPSSRSIGLLLRDDGLQIRAAAGPV